MTVDNKLPSPETELAARIVRLKKEKGAVILAHYYTLPEVQRIADFTGDSLALSQQAARTDARIILFAGVHFMAETAKILSPDKKVLLPEPAAGCSLADSCRAEDFAEFLKSYPGHTVVSYVNTSVGVKALTDICCTSSNAVDVIRSLPSDAKIVFAPDRNLGNYIGSTAALLRFASTDPADTFIVVTEAGILYRMRKENPGKTFIPAPPEDASCGCNNCAFMKMVTLDKIYRALLDESPEVVLDEEIRRKAEGSIRRMLEIGK